MKTCRQCSAGFEVTDTDRAFYEKVSPTFGGKKFLIPEPTLCPECRQVRRLVWRNERNLYHRPCGLCKKSIIVAIAEDSPYTVYCRDCWWGDGWDPFDYGRDFDFSRPFFDQFGELMKAVPRTALLCINVENCDYTNFLNDSRDSYLCFGAGFMEDCQYADWVYYAKNTFDCSFCQKSELDYMNVDCSETYHCKFLYDCHNVSDCLYSIDCRNCKNCFGCVGLRNKEYHLFNKPLSPEQYRTMTKKLKDPKHRQNIFEEVAKLKKDHPHLASRILNSENCTGDDIENCKDCHECFGIKDARDCKFSCDDIQNKDTMDANRTGLNELCYETVCGGYNQQSQFVNHTAYGAFMHYISECMHSKDIFASIGLKHKDHVIFNKPYSKEEYESLAARIIQHMRDTGEWGEMFPAALSPFAYNETVANEFFPLSEAQAKAQGFRWRPKEKQEYLPAHSDILACEVTGRNFKLTPQEIRFYKEESLPTPTRHPNQRYLDRLSLKLPRRLYDRPCAKCKAGVKTPYAPERPEIVVCEACYLKEVY